MKKNIVYRTEEIARYFALNRVKWGQFYESERVVIERLKPGAGSSILDIGCGCGGLGLALREKFGIENYTGVEINDAAAAAGRQMNPKARILRGDVLDLSAGELKGKLFDVVFSLSCVDWNVRYADMLAAAWKHVRPGGSFVATFRLTDEAGCQDIAKSYQHINYEGIPKGELAAYVVLNAGDLMRSLGEFDPSEISAFGYWGPPSATAVTPYKRLCFAAFSIRRRTAEDSGAARLRLDLPAEILGVIERSPR
ncbi:MAG: class I SAM-dependent methyltransferase [Elusimicrobiota bacterium]